jgi:hypothetical protein
MRFKIFLNIIFVLLAFSSEAQNFYRSYGNTDDEVAKGAVETKDSSFFIFGTSSSFVNGTSNFYLMKIDSTGFFDWSKSFGGNGIEQGNAIAMKPNGHYLLTGYSNSYGNGGYDILNIEIDSLGNEIWLKKHGGSDWDYAFDNTILPNGNSIITGSTFSIGNGNQDGFLMMLDNNGDSLWMKSYGNNDEDVLRKTILTSTGLLVSIGFTTETNGDKDFYVVKTDLNGDTLWTKKYGTTSNDEGFAICETIKGTYILAGYSEGVGAGGKEGFYFETDTNGIMIWNQNYGITQDEIFNAICIKPNENRFFAAWESASYGNGENDFVVNSLFTNGGWVDAAITYGTPMDEKPYDIIYTSHNRVLAVGSTNSPFGNLNIMAVLTDTLFPTQLNMINYIDVTSVQSSDERIVLNVFPNPSSEKINIQTTEIINHISIVDLTGRIVLEINDNNNQIDVSTLKPSIYILRIEFENGQFSTCEISITKQ